MTTVDKIIRLRELSLKITNNTNSMADNEEIGKLSEELKPVDRIETLIAALEAKKPTAPVPTKIADYQLTLMDFLTKEKVKGKLTLEECVEVAKAVLWIMELCLERQSELNEQRIIRPDTGLKLL